MRTGARRSMDKIFTGFTFMSVILIAVVLIGILMPMIRKGTGAIVFRGTVEFRRMQFERYNRGDEASISAETAAAWEARSRVYEMFDHFRRGIDTSDFEREARAIYSDFADELDYYDTPDDERLALRRIARRLRNHLLDAFETGETSVASEILARVTAESENDSLRRTAADRFFPLADRYAAILREIDPGHREKYRQALNEVAEALLKLFGLPPGHPRPALAQNQYGATRLDQVNHYLDDVLFAETWVSTGPGESLVKVRTPRHEQFAGTTLEGMFTLLQEGIDEMMRPRLTLYRQYFIDDSTPGHFFGGVWPEILGTLVLTCLAILLAFPVGVTAAAYLVEVAGDNPAVNLIRMCINTLAGVPSIVFGLFGLAFIVLWLFPKLGLQGEPCTLAAALTLAILILPVIIRASEEAIRAVPATYKEASLALGASRFRCFVTVQLPTAMPGILTGVILSMSRAAGETAPILFTGAVAMGPALELGKWPFLGWLFKSTRALSYGSYDIAVGDRLAAMVPHQQFGMVMALIGLVLLLNLSAIIIRSRISRKLRGQ